MPHNGLALAVAAGGLLLGGCGYAGEKVADARQAAYAAYQQAQAAFETGDYATAEPQFTAAIEARGLNPDVYCEAVVKRAVCWSVAGRHGEALAELQKMESGGAAEELVLAARSFVLAKQGKAAESRAALAKAKRINPRLQPFKN